MQYTIKDASGVVRFVADLPYTALPPHVAREAVRAALAAGVSLSGTNLNGINLNSTNLCGVDLSHTSLRETSLFGAALVGANLTGSDLFRADMCKADLRNANLRNANLYGASLTGATMHGANLKGTGLRGANLHGAKGIVSFGPVGGLGRIGYAVDHGALVMVQLGCFWGTSGSAVTAIETSYRGDRCAAYVGLLRAAVVALRAFGRED
jgi:hypothetical protein